MRSAILLVGASLSLLASSAQAQDITDWSGFYAGVLVGYGMDRTQTESSSSIIPPVEAGDDVFYSGSSRFSQERIEGLLGGVGAGYNFQHNQFVLGVDGDINFGDLDKTTSAFGSLTIDDREDGEVFELGQGSDTTYGIDWYSTFALRAGVTFDGWSMPKWARRWAMFRPIRHQISRLHPTFPPRICRYRRGLIHPRPIPASFYSGRHLALASKRC